MPNEAGEQSPRQEVGRWLVICAIVAVAVTVAAGSTASTTPLLVTYVIGASWVFLTAPATLTRWQPSWVGYLVLAVALFVLAVAALALRTPDPSPWVVAAPVGFLVVTAVVALRGVSWDAWLSGGLLLMLLSVGLGVAAGRGWVDPEWLDDPVFSLSLAPPVLLLFVASLVLISAGLLVGPESPNSRRMLLAGVVLAPTYLMEIILIAPILFLPLLILLVSAYSRSRIFIGVSILAVMPLFVLPLDYVRWPLDPGEISYLVVPLGMALLSAGMIMNDSRRQRTLAQIGCVLFGVWMLLSVGATPASGRGLQDVLFVIMGPPLATVPLWWGVVEKRGPVYRAVRRLRFAIDPTSYDPATATGSGGQHDSDR